MACSNPPQNWIPASLLTCLIAGCVATPSPPDDSHKAAQSGTQGQIDHNNLNSASDNHTRPLQVAPPQTAGIKSEASSSSSNSAAGKLRRKNRPIPAGPPKRTGSLKNPALKELSGLAASQLTPGALFAINDSGNSPTLYMIDKSGKDLAQWTIAALNRDWEDMATTNINGKPYLVIGDTGDNGLRRKKSSLHLFEEPTPEATNKQATLTAAITVHFSFEDGPRNVEAFAITDNTVYLISKERPTARGASASRLYALPLPTATPTEVLQASFVSTLPKGRFSVEAKLALALAGVDMNHPTALVFDETGHSAYILTYLDVLKVTRQENQSWSAAFAAPVEYLYSHNLEQAESMAINRRALWLSSENAHAPIWALPLPAPL